MTSRTDRFWISFILRLAFGFLFLIASINIFSAGGAHDFGPDFFARQLSKPFASAWTGDLLPEVPLPSFDAPEPEPPAGAAEGRAVPANAEGEGGGGAASKPAEKGHPAYYFLFALPFIFAGLSVSIVTGIFLRPALRLGAILLVLLGLGKYVTSGNDLSTTAHDFFFAFLICVGLYFLGQARSEETDLEMA